MLIVSGGIPSDFIWNAVIHLQITIFIRSGTDGASRTVPLRQFLLKLFRESDSTTHSVFSHQRQVAEAVSADGAATGALDAEGFQWNSFLTNVTSRPRCMFIAVSRG